MPVGQYPFIDIAVHEGIRERFARGEALVLFSADFHDVIWANGGGARLFGYRSIYEFMDEGGRSHPSALRQIEGAAARALANGTEQAVLMRPASGFRRSAVQARIATILLHGGARGFLLSGDPPGNEPNAVERAERIIEGLAETDTHVAVLDGSGQMLAASPAIAGLDIDPALRRSLVEEVGRERDRLVKRPISTARGRIPAAIARLADNPPLHLLFAVETGAGQDAPEPAATNDALPAPSPEPVRERASGTPRFPQVNAWHLAPAATQTVDAVAAQTDTLQEAPDEDAGVASYEPEEAPADAGIREADAEEPPALDETTEPDQDGFVFDPKGRPVRFVWKMDAEGRFSEISQEFADTLGPNAADVVGRRFADVARVFGLDRDHGIANLLDRRDTWSGRTVMWPVQGTSLSVPVDLAALPTYTRERVFSGFRGFGILRTGDAAEDPEAIGLSLTGPPAGLEPEPADKQEIATDDAAVAAGETVDGSAVAPRDAGDPEKEPAPIGDDIREQANSDPFQGEVPALRIVPTPERRNSDKVIQLEEHRPRTREGLSTGEQAAFREIGKRLASTFGRRDPDDDRAGDQQKTGPGTTQDNSAGGSGSSRDARKPPQAKAPASPPSAEAPANTEPDEITPPVRQERDGSDADEQPGVRSVVGLPSAFALPRTLAREGTLDERLVDELPVALLVHAGETVHHANPDFLAMTGYPDVAALRGAGGLAALFATPHYSGDGSGTLPGTMTLIRADGTEQAVHARLQSIGWQTGRALMLSLVEAPTEAAERPVVPETTEAEEHAAALMIEVEELRSILETATDGVVILGENGEIRSMNGSASALFDYDDAELRGQPFAKLFAHESQRAVMDYLNGLSEHGVASVLNDGREVIGREASGGFLPLFMTIGRLSGSNGYCAVMRDITQWKRTEEDLRSAKRAAEAASSHKSEFLARVSHEIRTPLNAIIGFSDMMAEQRFGPIGSPRYLEYAHDIGRSGKHVLDIVNDLLDISKIEAGEMEIVFTAVALNDTIAETVSLLQPQANGQRVIIRTSLSSSVPEIVADERSIRQIALNLVSNAIRFTPSGGQIVVSTAYEANGSVALRIRDTGIGMTRSELEQAMKPFRQVAGATRHRGDGTGLGLPLTKAMAEANRAQFEIRSAPGEGTLVEIVFPSQRVLAD